MSYLRNLGPRTPTPQSEPLAGQVQNSAGGHSWQLDDWGRLERFLILGSESGSYYATERELTKENTEIVKRCITADGSRTVRTIVELSNAGRAPKNDPALYALAMCAAIGNTETRRTALASLPKVARIGTHLFHFVQFVQQWRGWGRALSNGIKHWYEAQASADLSYQMIKYQQRDGFSHRDLLRLCHAKPNGDVARAALYHWAVKGWPDIGEEPHPDAVLRRVWAFERAKQATEAKEVVALIRDYGLPREAVPTQWLTDARVWEALLSDMPMGAMVRNLATMTRVGLLAPMGEAVGVVCAQLRDAERIRKARLHPIALLSALRTYQRGRGVRGSNEWVPVPQILDALNDAFYLAFESVTPTNKRHLLALDVSGSMGGGEIAGVPGLTPRDGAAAMALVTARTEPQYMTMAFSHQFVPLPISASQRLDDVIGMTSRLPFGGTDCALPMLWATQEKIPVDAFLVYTDNETWFGSIHPMQALQQYRQQTGIPAKLIVVGMVSSGFSIADPNDGSAMDVVGFDTAAPTVMSDFIAR